MTDDAGPRPLSTYLSSADLERHRRLATPEADPLVEAQAAVIRLLGYDAQDPHLTDSPPRVARFLREWHTIGRPAPSLTVFPNTEGYDQMVAVGHIRFYSLCAHHGLPFVGTAAIGYLPGASIVGLSKLARIVDHYAHRFQTQERLTMQIADHLTVALEPRGLGVVLRAEHLCMAMRGVERPDHSTITSDMRGALRDSQASRSELLTLVHP